MLFLDLLEGLGEVLFHEEVLYLESLSELVGFDFPEGVGVNFLLLDFG
jgi:hypothetical protein